ncbi:uncharacterized protein LOC8274361 [Ricinus communis]|uniref:uncharacterized protein LOC8274361 n=1 Tax=Ricinus communis TaxID=3988 RepID=UPI00201AE06B|nr:uncharacterized protein LOC8274361 [Ricinus communis]
MKFFVFLFILVLVVLGQEAADDCAPEKCGDELFIRFPFRLKEKQPKHCGYPDPRFDLSCEDNKFAEMELPNSVKVHIRSIDYALQTLHVFGTDGCLARNAKDFKLSTSNFQFSASLNDYALFNCSSENINSYAAISCLGGPGYQVYAFDSYNRIDDLPLTSCTKMYNLSSLPQDMFNDKDVISLTWSEPKCHDCEVPRKHCSWKNDSIVCLELPIRKADALIRLRTAGIVLGSCLLLIVSAAVFHVYRIYRKQKENQARIEKFLEDYKALKPTRYSYADLKRITNQFKDKLGQGAYGTVFKGRLSDEIFVAVKELNNSTGNGEEFINEVGTMGRIHHVNVVRLVGFCADGFRRALVYEFLPNESLEKFIFSNDGDNSSLGWEKLEDIALGIAKGIEYLHQGCDQRILHFDIKPHNILLDDNFTPKISDFGLAKLCAKDQSAVSMTAARGTMGYIAPEVFSRNFGSVSYKSDVYSFGMLLLEMVGGRKNIDIDVENSSQVFFPEWIYKHLDQEEELRIRILEIGDAKIAKKLTIVGLWCIQWYPADRPSMKVVVQMLEEEGGALTMPPNPFNSESAMKANAAMRGRRLHQELAVISEVECSEACNLRSYCITLHRMYKICYDQADDEEAIIWKLTSTRRVHEVADLPVDAALVEIEKALEASGEIQLLLQASLQLCSSRDDRQASFTSEERDCYLKLFYLDTFQDMASGLMDFLFSRCCICILLLLRSTVVCAGMGCPEMKCNRHGPPIKFPFSIKGSHQADCGYPGFYVSCTSTNETLLELPFSVKLFISKINYKSQKLHVYEPTGCLSKHLRNLNLSASPFQFGDKYLDDFTVFSCSIGEFVSWSEGHILSCVNNSPDRGIIAFYSRRSINYMPSLLSCTKLYNVSSVPHNMLFPERKIIFKWSTPNCRKCEAEGKLCRLNETSLQSETECLNILKQHKGASTKMKVTGAVLGSFFLGLVIAVYHFYRLDKTEKENQKRIRIFLEDYKALKPTRYSYADIKRITNEFMEQLGQGTYGTVYKGKLSNEILVAVKVLNNSIGNGNEFINEVSTMGRIHHVNVVRLVGYCADGFRRALVYEYLPRNSLQKYISSADTENHFLGWKKLQDIAVGIAKGIEYLHQGCDQRILHFDIKPHNILLDDNWNPKISDFGTAKLCSKDQSAVSMTAARGTMGYIAPEVFSRNFGNVSHKSDVYSFGMLVLEMVGGRKNVEVTPENACQVYFPEWIYNLLEHGEDLRLHIEEEGDANIAKKLAIVGLRCIQWHPVDRPSMNFVVQMLEGEENLTIPPNPFASTGSGRTYTAPAGRRRHQELEVIQELE